MRTRQTGCYLLFQSAFYVSPTLMRMQSANRRWSHVPSSILIELQLCGRASKESTARL
jgi:hypothetical protein